MPPRCHRPPAPLSRGDSHPSHRFIGSSQTARENGCVWMSGMIDWLKITQAPICTWARLYTCWLVYRTQIAAGPATRRSNKCPHLMAITPKCAVTMPPCVPHNLPKNNACAKLCGSTMLCTVSCTGTKNSRSHQMDDQPKQTKTDQNICAGTMAFGPYVFVRGRKPGLLVSPPRLRS